MSHAAPQPRAGGLRRWRPVPVTLSVLTLAAVLNLAGCFGGKEEAPPSPGSPTSTASTAATAPLDARIGAVEGKLTPAEKAAALSRLRSPVLAWMDAAYLAGDYPRAAGFDRSFGSFTAGTAEKARRDLGLLTNVDVAQRVETVTTKARRLRFDLLAVKHRVVGATARIALVFQTEGAYARTVTIKGRLFLTPVDGGGWKIFGYDLTRGEK